MVLGTLRDQLLYPHIDLKVEDSQLREILIQVNLADLEQRHGGFDTEKNWAEVLSLGEQQRLIFGRLLVNKPNYAILDEATSALDAESERLVQGALEAAMVGRTTLVIAHRLATVQRADRIVVMDAGCIVETGTHASLVAQGGIYANLLPCSFMWRRLNRASENMLTCR